MCAGQKFLLGQQPIAILDKLIKLMKIPEKRAVALDCIFFVITALFRNYEKSEFDVSKDLMLEKIRMEVFHSMRKTSKECIPIMVDLVFLICIFDIKYAFPNFILPMLSPDASMELQIVGMRTFNAIADNTHITFDKTYAFIKRPFLRNDYRRSIHTDLRLQEYSSRSLNIQESVLNTFQGALCNVIQHANSQIGNFLRHTARGNDLSAKPEQFMYIDILATGITCISRVPPSGMFTCDLIQFLVYKSFHIHNRIADEARLLLLALIRTRPALRISIVEELGFFILNIPEENTTLIRSAVSYLIELIITWYDPLALNAREVDLDYIDDTVSNRILFNASFFEGISLLLLCSSSVHVRNVAYNLLVEVDTLNKVLPHSISEQGLRVLQVIEKYELELMRLHSLNSGGLSCHFSSVEEIAVGCSEGEQEEWAHCIGTLIPFLRQENSESIYITYSIICTRIEQLTTTFFPLKKPQTVTNSSQKKDIDFYPASTSTTETPFDELILWRNMALFGCAVGEGSPLPTLNSLGYDSCKL